MMWLIADTNNKVWKKSSIVDTLVLDYISNTMSFNLCKSINKCMHFTWKVMRNDAAWVVFRFNNAACQRDWFARRFVARRCSRGSIRKSMEKCIYLNINIDSIVYTLITPFKWGLNHAKRIKNESEFGCESIVNPLDR